MKLASTVRVRLQLALLIATSPAAADPVATVTPDHVERDQPATTVEPAPEPSAEQLAAAPPADQASGIAVPGPREDHSVANSVLALPRLTARLLLRGPRFAAGEVDDYLENRSPNAFGRDVHDSWRFGATAEWEDELGPDLAVRVGRELARSTAIDGYVGVLGARGESGGLRVKLGDHTAAHLTPTLTFDAGRDLDRAFAGISAPGTVVVYDQEIVAGSAALGARAGWFGVTARAGYDVSRTGDSSGDWVAVYNPLLPGFDETEHATTGELSAGYDSRRPTHPWIKRSAPSTGFLLRATGGYTSGTGSRSGAFSFTRETIETRKLFDLFHGDRVLSIGAMFESQSTDLVPFDRLPTLGGRDRMRAFVRDQLRGIRTAYADVQYEWPLGDDSRAYMFGEAGGASLDAYQLVHYGYGGGIRFLTGSSTAARFQIAGATTGEVGFFLQLGAL